METSKIHQKSYLWQMLIAFYVLAVQGCDKHTFYYDDTKLIYSSAGNKALGGGGLEEEFSAAFKGQKPIVLFVHGRGSEPNKSLNGTGPIVRWWIEGHAVRKIEATYDVTVYLFSWDSARLDGFGNLKDRSRPLGNIENAGERLKTVINAIHKAKKQSQNPQKIVLLAHSMGTIVLQNLALKEKGKLPQELFDNIVLTGADADNLGHKAWLDVVGKWSPTYLVINPNDDTLRKSCDSRPTGMNPLGRDPLGLGSEDKTDPKDTLSQHVTYFWLGSPNKKTTAHEIFYRDDWSGFESLKEFFMLALRGQHLSVKSHVGEGVDNGCLDDRSLLKRAWDWLAPPL